MKSPSEIAREIAEEVLIKSGLYQRAGVWPDDIDDSKCLRLVTQAITTERQRQERLIELVDGCTPVIESWAVISVAQAEWKKGWLSEAQQVLREVKGA